MKLKIQDYCIRCGTCIDLHGELFEFNVEEDCIDLKHEVVPEDLEAEAKKAIADCHIAAIHVVKDKPYAKYLDTPVAKLTPEQIQMVMTSKGATEDALEFVDRALLMSVDSKPAKFGYYPLAGGGMLIAGNVFMPGVTAEMIDWWASWHSLEPIRYQIWHPEDHHSIEVDEIGKQRALDSSIPNFQKLWGATHVAMESLGGTPDKVTMHFANPAEVGFDTALIGTEKSSAFLCGNAKLGDMMAIPVFMAENFVERNGGLEVRARFWVGYQVVNGQDMFLLPPGMSVPEPVAMGLLMHNIKEFEHLAKVLPDLYAEYKDKWIV